MLKRQARIRPRRDLQASTSAAPLSMILEEEDAANLSSSSSSSATKDLKSRRRRANIISDPFHLTFTQVAYPFPHPPVPTPSSMPPSICPPSPGSSSSSTSATPSPYSSPRSHSTSLPTSPEPSSSEEDDDDVFSYPQTKPLVINKIHRRVHKKISCEELSGNLDEDYEYYTQEFNKIISLSSLYAPAHSQNSVSRPESGCALPSPQKTRPKSLTIVRPPPRTSLPVPAEADEDGADVLLYYLEGVSLSSGSHYSESVSSARSPRTGRRHLIPCLARRLHLRPGLVRQPSFPPFPSPVRLSIWKQISRVVLKSSAHGWRRPLRNLPPRNSSAT